MRFFIAIDISPSIKKEILRLTAILKKGDPDVKWVNENKIHITLKFLGNIEEKNIKPISEAIREICRKHNTFNVTFSELGAFPRIAKPKVLWLGIDKGSDFLTNLAKDIDSGLVNIGFKSEEREFKPHLTIGRVRSLRNIPALTGSIKKTNFLLKETTEVNQVVLFQSILDPKGAIHNPISHFTLKQLYPVTNS